MTPSTLTPTRYGLFQGPMVDRQALSYSQVPLARYLRRHAKAFSGHAK